jgi:hypothetical protein
MNAKPDEQDQLRYDVFVGQGSGKRSRWERLSTQASDESAS